MTKNKEIQKLSFNNLMNRYEEIINSEFEFPSFCSYYVTDNDCDSTKEKPYKLKCLWFTPIPNKNENNKYVLSEEQKTKFKNILIETFNKENMYLF